MGENGRGSEIPFISGKAVEVIIIAKNMAKCSEPLEVLESSDVAEVGDEALVLKKLSGVSVYVGSNKANLISYVDQLYIFMKYYHLLKVSFFESINFLLYFNGFLNILIV